MIAIYNTSIAIKVVICQHKLLKEKENISEELWVFKMENVI